MIPCKCLKKRNLLMEDFSDMKVFLFHEANFDKDPPQHEQIKPFKLMW